MKGPALLALGFSLFAAAPLSAQLHVPLSDIALAYPSVPAITIKLGSPSRTILPTPFVIDAPFERSALWLCMDPLQTIFVGSSGQPAGAEMIYGSDDPGLYDKWTPLAPGLAPDRLQDLADLFTAYAPTRTNLLLGAALQLAVPEITNEFDSYAYDLFTGKFQAFTNTNATANSIIALAQSMLASLNTPGIQGRGNIDGLRFLIDGHYGTTPVQDLVGFVPVPEPSTYALFGLALMTPAIVLRLRRRQRSQPAPQKP